ncbi:MAG: penicillin acylase family protein, partial [Betaproteobacteria bacterium]
MPRSLLRPATVAAALGLLAACRQYSAPVTTSAPRGLVAQVAGTLAVDGLRAPVRVVRDRWGVPHIDAENEHDLFFAQGFVQAEDRLFQMDLWRRSVQGRVSEVLGANFVQRDAMTRRIQYRGDVEADWDASAPGAKAIAEAFVAGINAWVTRARAKPPEEFVLAGWQPEPWRAGDLLNRTDAFLASGDALQEVLRARIVHAVGERRAALLLPGIEVPGGLDVSAVGEAVADGLRAVGTAPFFVGLAAPVSGERQRADGSNAWALSASRTGTGAAVLAADPHRLLTSPSPFYLVHLHAPGWNVAGAAVPWLPGVVMGHNNRIAWGFTSFDADVEDLYEERTNPANPNEIDAGGRWTAIAADRAPLLVRGRTKPIDFVRQTTPHGVI